jgi:hypothetical protein
MANRVSFSGQHLGLLEIAAHHQDLQSSLNLYFSNASPTFPVRFTGYLKAEVIDELDDRLEETDLSSSLLVLASVEAAFRIDYLQRCYCKDKSPLSRHFRDIYNIKQQHVSLEEEIFEAWATHNEVERSLVGELRGAFRFRHWLAHGRYWTPKLGRRYNYNDIYALADETFQNFPFFGY